MRGLSALLAVTVIVLNLTGRPLVLDLYCEGYPYGQPQVIPPGGTAAWTWRPGVTTASDLSGRIWPPYEPGERPRLPARRIGPGQLLVPLRDFEPGQVCQPRYDP